ncbi:MAG: YraN family protein [Patescibacteria group bacterium]|jgi:putative endonuclease
MNVRSELGRLGEQYAVQYLEHSGWKVLAQNARFKQLEVDIIAARGGTVAFVEVKTRRGDAFGSPEEAITKAKVRRLAIALAQYARQNAVTNCRIDAIAIVFGFDDKKPILRHYEAIGGSNLAFLP